MSWDEGKPMPTSAPAKKQEVRQMMGAKPLPQDKYVDTPSLPGEFNHARIEPAGNGFMLSVDRKGGKGVPEGDSGKESMGLHDNVKEHKTVHTDHSSLLNELSKHIAPIKTK